jgi:hypothetical protein
VLLLFAVLIRLLAALLMAALALIRLVLLLLLVGVGLAGSLLVLAFARIVLSLIRFVVHGFNSPRNLVSSNEQGLFTFAPAPCISCLAG